MGAVGVTASKYQLIGDLKLVSDLAGEEAAAALRVMSKAGAAVGNLAGAGGVIIDGYNGFKYDLPGLKMSASIGAGGLLAGFALGGPFGAAVGFATGLLGLYVNGSVP